jgi:predicted nucleic acid-binding Zn ribbon protein
MTTREANLIERYRQEGMGAKKIAAELKLPLNTIKSYLRRHPAEEADLYCLQCGKAIKQLRGTREKKFCSDKCRLDWWHKHQEQLQRKTTEQVCAFCGKTFATHKKDQRFCSRLCYGNSMRKEALTNVS